MFEEVKQQDIINDSFKQTIERENEIIQKCSQYKTGNKNESVAELIESILAHSKNNISKISPLKEKLKLDYNSKEKVTLTDLDKIQILLKDMIQLYQLYCDLVIKNENPEARKLFTLFRDSSAEDIFYLQQCINRLIFTQKPISKSIK